MRWWRIRSRRLGEATMRPRASSRSCKRPSSWLVVRSRLLCSHLVLHCLLGELKGGGDSLQRLRSWPSCLRSGAYFFVYIGTEWHTVRRLPPSPKLEFPKFYFEELSEFEPMCYRVPSSATSTKLIDPWTGPAHFHG